MSKSHFDGRHATLGSVVLVNTGMQRQTSEMFATAVFPAVVEAIAPNDDITFRLSDGRTVQSRSLEGYDVDHQRSVSEDNGFIATTIETVDRMPLYSWTWPPR